MEALQASALPLGYATLKESLYNRLAYNESREKGKEKERWHPGSNWGVEALQASALPLGYTTL
jgi:hypothetical protein